MSELSNRAASGFTLHSYLHGCCRKTKSNIFLLKGMEGYVYRKTGFGGFFVRTFAVLDKQRLSFYETLDTETHAYNGFKGSIFVKNGLLESTKDGMRNYCLKISESKEEMKNNGKSEFLDCGDPKNCQAWATALNRAFKYHTDQLKKREEPRKFRRLLELPEDGKLTKAQIAKNYKRVCLKNHPDKGGDANLFAEMASAYNALLIIQDYEDKYADCEVVEYELVLIKGKQGLGFSVAEDRAKGGVYVSDVHENIQVVGITAESQGEIRIHDRILGIDKDDASDWPISRIRARLHNSRVNRGQRITFIMERLVTPADKTDSTETEGGKEENGTPNKEPNLTTDSASPPPAPFFPSSSSRSYDHYYQGGRSEPSTPFSPSNDSSFKDNNWEVSERKALNEEINRLKEQLEIANSKVEEATEAARDTEKKGLHESINIPNEFDEMKRKELSKILLHCQRTLSSMCVDSDVTNNVREKIVEVQECHNTAIELLAFSEEEISKFVEEQETNEKLHERIKKIEALVIDSMTRGK